MSYIIYKYSLEVTAEQTITITEDYDLLDVQVQDGKICVWIAIRTDQPKDNKVSIVLCGTGQELTSELLDILEHIGTVQLNGMVWHLFVGNE